MSFPKGWTDTNFEEVLVSITNGISDKQNQEKIGIPVTRIETIATEIVNLDRIGFVDGFDEKKLEKYKLNKGDILFSHINSPLHLGKTAIFEGEQLLYHGTNLLRLVVNPKIYDYRLFNYYCKYLRMTGEFAQQAQHAVNQSSLNQKKLKAFEILLPPINEQKRIAQKLDELLVTVESIKIRLDNILTTIKRFRQSILSAAISGKLTDAYHYQDEKFYTTLSNWITSNQKKLKSKPLQDEEIVEAKTLFGDLEKWNDWKLFPLEQLVDPIRGIPYGIVQTGQNYKDGIPTIRCGDIKRLSIDIENLKHVDPEISNNYSRTILHGGEVLLAIRGTVGNAAVVNEKLAGLNISREVAMIPVSKFILPDFMAILLQSPNGYKCLSKKVKGVAQQGINLKDIKRFVTPVPTLEEQKEIVAQVESFLSLVDTLEEKIKVTKKRVDKLTQSILAKAFRGQLIPQDPNDESAEKLLERIKAKNKNDMPK